MAVAARLRSWDSAQDGDNALPSPAPSSLQLQLSGQHPQHPKRAEQEAGVPALLLNPAPDIHWYSKLCLEPLRCLHQAMSHCGLFGLNA